jgi:hypothetical protein
MVSLFIGHVLNFSNIQKRVEALHQSQVNAYREAATKAIKEWAAAFPLEPMEDADSEQAFVDRCTSALVFVPSIKGSATHTWPNWKLENAKALASLEVRKRARAIYEKYHPTKDEEEEEGEPDENSEEGMTEEGEETEETGDEDEGEDDDNEEEGEEEDGEVDNNAKPSDGKPKTQQLKGKGKTKRKGTNGKSAAARKKGTAAKGFRKGQSSRGRGRGRGGAHAKKNNSSS